MKVALVYDRINKWGGAERILLLLHEIFPSAPIYTSVYDAAAAPWAKGLDIKTSFLERLPYARRHHEFFATIMPLAFESFNFDSYDLVISLTSESAKGIITKPGTRHICICLTPTRYLWSSYESYFAKEPMRTLSIPIVWYLRAWDKAAANRPDKLIAISKTVQGRIKKFYNRDSEVIYPPLFLDKSVDAKKTTTVNSENYYLVVSRLSKFTPHKRVEIAIEAANTLKLPLKVVGDGDTSYFKKMAGPTVDIVGKVTDEVLSEYYRSCAALIFPGVEDFGLVMVEAQAAGKPVIAYKEGGATEIVIEGKTGMFFESPTSAALVKALKSFDKSKYNSKVIKRNAQRFSIKEFKKQIMSAVI